jgi:hypothetical protein
MRRCSAEISIPCRCAPDAPFVGTSLYAEERTHPDAGDLDALRMVTEWVRAKTPCLHLRFADGEFWSILNRKGINTDGMPFYGESLGPYLDRSLQEMSSGALKGKSAIIGGDWSIPEHEAYIRKSGFMRTVPWCPSSIWVNGVVSGTLARFFETLLADPRPRVLVANEKISGAATFLRSMFFPIPAHAAWEARAAVASFLKTLPRDTVVLYCAGMASEGFAWESWKERPDLTHLDMGHVFDGAFGIRNRSWLLPDGYCLRRNTYFERYVPVILGKAASFGEFE